jgi:hypothetical protein
MYDAYQNRALLIFCSCCCGRALQAIFTYFGAFAPELFDGRD